MTESITQKPKPSKNKGIYSCPVLLQEIIELVNLLPPHSTKEIQDKLNGEIKRIKMIIEGAEEKYADFYMSKAYQKLTKRLSISFIEVAFEVIDEEKILLYMFNEDNNHLLQDKWTFAINRYFDLVRTRHIFRTIADEFEDLLSDYPELHSYQLLEFATLFGYLTVTNEGFIKPNFSEIISIFQNENIYYANIRICEVCEKIFWAKREKSKTCSRVCTNILVNRVYRKTNKDRINENRRLTYQSKKELAKGKKRRK